MFVFSMLKGVVCDPTAPTGDVVVEMLAIVLCVPQHSAFFWDCCENAALV